MRALRWAIPIALAVAGPMVMLYPIWANPVSAGEDDVVYYWPLRVMVGRALRQGRLPLNNPAEGTGSALMADPQSAVMYPPTWLFATIDEKLAYSLSIFLAFSLAGGGAYLYLRRIALCRPAAAFGMTAFMFCGFMVGHRVHLAMIHTACYLPWGLWCIEGLSAAQRSAKRAVGLKTIASMTPVVFLAIAAGHWPTLIHMAVIWTAYLLLRSRPLFGSLVVVASAVVLAGLLAWPQIVLTANLLSQATRARIGYATAGENSFFPLAGILAIFPMIMGSRSPNFYPQKWWGPWHLTEMLGYIGLVTLVLAGAGAWKLYRPKLSEGPSLEYSGQDALGELVRKWCWIAAGAGLWMLGYYLPTYRLVHMLGVLGVVRCPARMVLAVDMALAVLAAVSIHVVTSKLPWARTRQGLVKAIRRSGTLYLPVLMLVVLGLLAIAGRALSFFRFNRLACFSGGTRDMAQAVSLGNSAVWIPLTLMVVTIILVRYWLKDPRRRTWVLVLLVLVDLFSITRFVDVSPAGPAIHEPSLSPAGQWLGKHGPAPGTYRVWSIGESYHDRPVELLLPKTANSLGFATLAGYGPFQSPSHAHLLGIRIFGTTRDWATLVRRNYLLSLYGVRYLITAKQEYRSVIESVTAGSRRAYPAGGELLGEKWSLKRAVVSDGTVKLCGGVWGRWSQADQPISLDRGKVYTISLDAHSLAGGAPGFLRADVFETFGDGTYRQDEKTALMVYPEQIARRWRHFEWTFEAPTAVGSTVFRLLTASESPIEVRNVSLRCGHWPVPLELEPNLTPGSKIYRKVAELPAIQIGSDPVVIYENLLCLNGPGLQPARPDEAKLERLKWARSFEEVASIGVLDLGTRTEVSCEGMKSAGALSVCGTIAYTVVLASIFAGRIRKDLL